MRKLLTALTLLNFLRNALSGPLLVGLVILVGAALLLNPLLAVGILAVVSIYGGAKLHSFLS